MPQLRHQEIIRYITPLREGGSLPAIAEADDGFMYVVKFRGAGQGIKALIAELIGGQIAKQLGLKIPELIFASLSEAFGRTEPDEEIQDLLKASTGLNLGLHYLNGSVTFDGVMHTVDSATASLIVWLDCFITNVDRTCRNTNMLMWKRELWLIDHGASLFFHHSWDDWKQKATMPFSYIKDHCLLPSATDMELADKKAKSLLSSDILEAIINEIPDEWLEKAESPFANTREHRQAYLQFLSNRLAHSSTFVKAAIDAREEII